MKPQAVPGHEVSAESLAEMQTRLSELGVSNAELDLSAIPSGEVLSTFRDTLIEIINSGTSQMPLDILQELAAQAIQYNTELSAHEEAELPRNERTSLGEKYNWIKTDNGVQYTLPPNTSYEEAIAEVKAALSAHPDRTGVGITDFTEQWLSENRASELDSRTEDARTIEVVGRVDHTFCGGKGYQSGVLRRAGLVFATEEEGALAWMLTYLETGENIFQGGGSRTASPNRAIEVSYGIGVSIIQYEVADRYGDFSACGARHL
ncbi:MAG: hypothetical protein KDD55_08460 [Bdellovibrionales bacterium]|nr:hypothetical protein [Bdellovibrionales bacterium]